MENTESKPKEERLVVTNIPKELKQQVMNISENLGETMTGFMKNKLREIVRSYPENMRVVQED